MSDNDRASGLGRRWSPVAARRSPLNRVILVAIVLSVPACSWFTDFKQQPKIDPWESPSDTIPPRGNPQGSVSIYGSAAPGFLYDRLNMPTSLTAMAGIPNPVPADSASVSRGRIQYQINCSVCHGPLGMGNGSAVKYGIFPPAIGAGSNAANALTDGYIFAIMRNGRVTMPSYNRIEEPDRWDIVNYLRSIQGKIAVPADSTHCRPGETGLCVPGASLMGPTRSAPYFHAGAVNEPPAVPVARDTTMKKSPTDTTRKPEHQP